MLVFGIFFIALFLNQANSLNPIYLRAADIPKMSRLKLRFRAYVEANYKENTIKCGGSLIVSTSIRWIITAAHCVKGDPLKVVVTMGAHNLSNPDETDRQVFSENNKIFIYDNYNESTPHENDIALIRLGKLPRETDYVKTVRIAGGDQKYEGQRGIIMRWGLNEPKELSEIPRQVDVIIVANNACQVLIGSDVEIKDTHVCTYKCLKECDGAPGASLTLKRGAIMKVALLGVVAFTDKDCSERNVSLFTRVSSFEDWILKTTGFEENTKSTSSADADKIEKRSSRSFVITANVWLLIMSIFLNKAYS